MQLAEINKIQIKPITNQSEFKEANKIIDLLIDANLIEDKKVRKRSLDILEAVSILANEYEKKHFPIPKPNPIEAIKERMEQLSLSQKDVAVYFGGENRVSEVLSGKRRLTLNMIRSLNKNLNISTDVLIGV
ncbi:MAG: helix-turn-helix domain-containing protein [Saprospiraceae bacterium]|nr:helix-turn-helix domain-containing protein [Candidatus Brachybacter algidus]MBP8890925.1 helix-turn-helix domain-containing protein [Saprospiraceae bacterium]MBP9124293.1 helix-turn-helix domain-containing protein [Saprospiraceae bacterium]